MPDLLNFGFISLDIAVVLAIIFLLIVLSFRYGKKPIATLIVSAFPTLLFFQYLPLQSVSEPLAEAAIFVITYAIVVLIIKKNIHVPKVHTHLRKIVDYGLLSISFVLMILSIQLNSVLSLKSIYVFSPEVTTLVNQVPYFVALIIPLIILLLTNKRD